VLDAPACGRAKETTMAKKPAPKETTKKAAARKTAARGTTAKPAARAAKPAVANTGAQTPTTPATEPTARMTCLDAAHAVLVRLNRPLRVRELIEQMADCDLWQSPAGATPESTVTAAIIREMKKRGGESRFQRVDRGFYAAREWEG
jgi:hypothetical protein